jgi:transposase-like protein
MRNQKKYDREFKLNVIKHHRESGKSLTAISRDFEVPMGTLSGWIQEFKEQGEKSFPGSGKIKPCNEEMYRLRKELTDMKQERDILKKAMAIFSRPRSGN